MFSNITHQDKEAFFSLLDEYFASRGHALASVTSPPAVDAASHPLRSQPPAIRNQPGPISPPPSASHYTAPVSPTASRTTHEYETSPESQEIPDMAQRFISSGVKYGSAGAKSSVGAISRNKDAMNLLGKAGMGGMMGKANERLNKPSSPTEPSGNRAAPPPVAPKKGGGRIGTRFLEGMGWFIRIHHKLTKLRRLVMSIPQARWAPLQACGKIRRVSIAGDQDDEDVNHQSLAKQPESIHLPPALSHSQSNLPPPLRRDRSSSQHAASPSADTSAPAGGDLANGTGVQEGQAQALYDYAGTDSGDLTVQANQVVNIVAKTSSDWWTCEDGNGKKGLVPATYLQEI